jgi:ubiquinone/menaquinone biosynthesis C-methylase UbiE
MVKRFDIRNDEFHNIQENIDLKDKKIIDVGCGNGRLSILLAQYCKEIIGVDPDETAVIQAQELHAEKYNLKFIVMNGKKLSFEDESFDILIFSLSLCCMESLDAIEKAINEAWRILKPDGLLLNIQASSQLNFNSGKIGYLITNEPERLVLWENGHMSRFGLKKSTHIHKKWELIKELDFNTKWQYETIKDQIEDIKDTFGDQYKKLSSKRKLEIDKYIQSKMTDDGFIYDVSETLTILQKQV